MDDYVVACQEESIGGSNFKVCNQCVPNDPVGDGCRIMNYNRNDCWTCFHSYYFDQDKCVLGAFLVNCYTYNFDIKSHNHNILIILNNPIIHTVINVCNMM